MINALNFGLVHSQIVETDIGHICTQIKHFICEICDMAIERFVQAESLFGEALPGETN